MRTSVAICTYNGQDYIEKQLMSIIRQETTVDEIVVCDDGSQDRTIEIVNSIASSHSQIKWLIIKHDYNIGVVRNFEEAISHCSGEIIFLSDQDDIWLPHKVQTTLAFFEQHPTISVVFTDAELVDGADKRISAYTLWDAVRFSPFISLWEAGCGFEIFNYHNMATGATMAIRKSFYDKLPPFINNYGYLHDYQLSLAAILSNAIGIICQPLIQYRIHEKNTVGIRKDSWIYQTHTVLNNPDIALYIEPYPLNAYVQFLRDQMHIEPPYLYSKRIEKYATLLGKLWLLCHIRDYKKRYKQFWKTFFMSDILYGILKR